MCPTRLSPAGMGQIHMTEVRCSGSEKSLWGCRYKNTTQEGCKHAEDAGVRCNAPYMGYEGTVSCAGRVCPFSRRVEGQEAQPSSAVAIGSPTGWTLRSPPSQRWAPTSCGLPAALRPRGAEPQVELAWRLLLPQKLPAPSCLPPGPARVRRGQGGLVFSGATGVLSSGHGPCSLPACA